MGIRNRVAILVLVTAAAAGMASSLASAADGSLKGVMSARAARPLPEIAAVALEAQDRSDTSVKLRGLLHDMLESRGYVLDAFAGHTLAFRWRGPFWTAPKEGAQGQLTGKGGSETAPSLGFSIILPLPTKTRGVAVYTIGLRLSDRQGEIWAAKAAATATNMKPAAIARALFDRMLDHLGEEITEIGFSNPQPGTGKAGD